MYREFLLKKSIVLEESWRRGLVVLDKVCIFAGISYLLFDKTVFAFLYVLFVNFGLIFN